MQPENKPEQRTLELEHFLAGEWQNPADDRLWHFSPGREAERYGSVLIVDKKKGDSTQLRYEAIWVREGLAFLNLLDASFDRMDQYQLLPADENMLTLSLLLAMNENCAPSTTLKRTSARNLP